MTEISTTRNFGCQKFLPYRRNFYFPISRIKFQTSFAIIIFRYLSSIMDIFYGASLLDLVPKGRRHEIGQILAKIADIAESANEACMAIYGHMKVMSTNSNVLKLLFFDMRSKIDPFPDNFRILTKFGLF